jgi:hypothetical protein
MMEGWIKLHRQLIERGWLKNPKLLTFWIYCLLKATHQPVKAKVGYQEVDLEAGQFIFGLRKASDESFLSVRTIRTCLDFLRKAGNLTIKTTNRFSIISIINWELYQGDNSANDTQSDKQTTNKRQHTRTKEQKKTSGDLPNPAVKEFIDFWYLTFRERFGQPYRVEGGKDGALLKSLLKTYSLDRLKSLAGAFFKSTDPFIQKSGYTIGSFSSQMNKLIVDETQRRSQW